MVTKRPKKKGKRYLNCTPSKSRPHEPSLPLLVFTESTLFNYKRYSCTGAFFDLIEWLKDYFEDLHLYSIF